jgi:hypothetical protein
MQPRGTISCAAIGQEQSFVMRAEWCRKEVGLGLNLRVRQRVVQLHYLYFAFCDFHVHKGDGREIATLKEKRPKRVSTLKVALNIDSPSMGSET